MLWFFVLSTEDPADIQTCRAVISVCSAGESSRWVQRDTQQSRRNGEGETTVQNVALVGRAFICWGLPQMLFNKKECIPLNDAENGPSQTSVQTVCSYETQHFIPTDSLKSLTSLLHPQCSGH